MKPQETTRPWGKFLQFTDNELSTVKLLYINKGEELSLQYHNKREEFWRVLRGNPQITIGDDVFSAKEGDEFNIGVNIKHRIGSPNNDSVILEIATGDFYEDDIVRVEDKYGRAT